MAIRARVTRREGEDVEVLLKRFKRQVNDEKILADIKKHECFISRGEKRREAKKEAIIKARKQARLLANSWKPKFGKD